MEVNVQLNYNISWRPKSVFILPNSLENRGLEQILLTTNYLLMEITNFQLFSMKIQGYIGDNSLLVTIPEVTSSYGDRMNCIQWYLVMLREWSKKWKKFDLRPFGAYPPPKWGLIFTIFFWLPCVPRGCFFCWTLWIMSSPSLGGVQ